MIGSKNLSFWDNWKSSPQLQLIILLRINQFWFSWLLQVSRNWQKPKKKYMADDGYTKKIRVWRASRIFDFANEFFSQKIQHKGLGLEIQLILSILWLWRLKISVKSKKWSKSVKNDTKDEIMWVWSELRPKLQQLALNKVVLTSAATTWSLTMSRFAPNKSPNSANVNYSFHWKLKGCRALILTDLDNLMAIFDFDHL